MGVFYASSSEHLRCLFTLDVSYLIKCFVNLIDFALCSTPVYFWNERLTRVPLVFIY